MTWIFLVSLALADVIMMPTADSCPEGARPVSHGHGGIACVLHTCEKATDCHGIDGMVPRPDHEASCEERKVCTSTARYVTNPVDGRMEPPDDYEPQFREYQRVYGACGEDGACASGSCETHKVCVQRPAKPPPEEAAADEAESEGCATAPHGVIPAGLGVVVLALVFAGRRRPGQP